jgi:diaminohydroxyphosphoribosylaminopyrimidine deaminase/5-amino-6-(5-phosphoribosylamino)uracil reductase
MNEVYMNMARELANGGSGFVNPGPLVGAIIVKEGRIIGQGYYKAYGCEKAEIDAIKNSIENTKDGELFINIEPELTIEDKNYIDFILNSGIKKIYLGMENPKSGFKGQMNRIFSNLGIDVEYNILKEKCEELNEIYTHYVNKGTPYVFTKWAMTLDGKLASRTGDSKWISSEKSLEFVHHLRQRVAAIMVGENTVKVDNPLLTTRLTGITISNPLRVIVSKYGDLPFDSHVLKVGENVKTLIVASTKIDEKKEKEILSTGAEMVKVEEVDGKLPFKEIVKLLGEKNIDSLYIEGGSSLLGSAFESGIVNKVYVAIAPKIIGGQNAVTPVGGLGIEKMNDAIRLKKVSHEIVGDDVIFKGYIAE